MSTLARFLSAGLLALALGGASAAFASDNAAAPIHPDSSSWPSLYKQDLSDTDCPAGVWIIEDGILTAAKDECIWSRKEYGDFIIDLEFKNQSGTNSGVLIRATDTNNWIPHSIEIQIADDFSEHWSKQPATWHCAALFGHVPPVKSNVKAPGEWNRMTITCKGPMITVALNGEIVTQADLRQHTSAKKNPDGSDIPAWLSTPLADLAGRGKIGLQGKHGDASIFFRYVRIKEL